MSLTLKYFGNLYQIRAYKSLLTSFMLFTVCGLGPVNEIQAAEKPTKPKEPAILEPQCLPDHQVAVKAYQVNSKKGEQRALVYAEQPFQSGEFAEYEMRYYGVLVGYGILEVRPPRKHKGKWVRVFTASGKTGEWYNNIFQADDGIEALSNADNFAIEKFYLRQDEGKIFGKRYQREKWLDFDHPNCKVLEKNLVLNKNKEPEISTLFMLPGDIDALSVAFWLRTRTYTLGKVETAPVYTSGQSWQLEAKPVKNEEIKVPAGTFKTVQLELKTYLGKELQQRGKVLVWVATEHVARPIVKIEGEIKIGSVLMELKTLKTGK